MQIEQLSEIPGYILRSKNVRAGLYAGVLLSETLLATPPSYAQDLHQPTVVTQRWADWQRLLLRLSASSFVTGLAIGAAVNASQRNRNNLGWEKPGTVSTAALYGIGGAAGDILIWTVPLPF